MMICDICGGHAIRKTAENVYVCQDCGCQYTLEEARRLLQGGGSAPRSTAPAPASRDFQIEGGVLKAYRGNDPDVTVPAGVVAVGEKAFAGLKGVRSVVLPEGLTEIESGAFENCEWLEEVRLPSSLKKIGKCAFLGCSSLRELRIPEGVTSIGHHAFSDCARIRELRIPDSVTEFEFNDYDLQRCTGLEAISLPRHKGFPESCSCKVEYRDKEEDAAWRAEKARKEREQRNFWRSAGLCDHCGGVFEGGLFHKTCARCHRKKSY